MKLNYKKLGQGKPLLILHGLLGMLDNWQNIGKILSQNFEVFLIDVRNHGHSPHSDIFNYEAMAEDLLEFIRLEVLPNGAAKAQRAFERDSGNGGGAYILGHSMGGKIAMKFAQLFPERIEKLIVVDIAPRKYPVHHDTIFEALLSVDLGTMKSRKEVEIILAKFIPENYILQFLLKNLYWKETGQLAWRFNLEAITKNSEKIGIATTEKIFSKPALFLRGEKSDYIEEEDFELIKTYFPLAEIKTIPGAGHWIHAEQPELFVEAVVEFLVK